MFKVGDLVERRPENPTKTFTPGKAYRVSGVQSGTRMIMLEGVNYYWQSARFKLVTSNIQRNIPWL